MNKDQKQEILINRDQGRELLLLVAEELLQDLVMDAYKLGRLHGRGELAVPLAQDDDAPGRP